jgi:hypothetical protein
MNERPKVAPYDSCVSCFKGDTTTGFGVRGSAEAAVAMLAKFGGMSQDKATATFLVYAEQDLGCDPGMVPTGQIEVGFRLCRDCAERTGTHVGELPGQIPAYGFPEDVA